MFLCTPLRYSHRYRKSCGWRTRHTDVLHCWRVEGEDAWRWQVQCTVESSSHGQHRLSNIFIFVYFLFYVYECLTYTYVCASHACLVPLETEEGDGSLQTGVTEGYELWVLGIQPRCSGRAARALLPWSSLYLMWPFFVEPLPGDSS